MRVLVTGSSGFIGRRVVAALAAAGAEPVGFDVVAPDARWPPAGMAFVRGSVANLEEVLAAVVDHRVQRIVALGYVQAPLMAPGYRELLGAVKVNLLGITHLFETARLTGVERVVFASSCAVYGPQRQFGDRPITEADVGRPRSTYGLMKLVNEDLANRYAQAFGLQIVKLRASLVIGQGDTQWSARMISPPALGEPGRAPFHAESRLNVIAVQDVAELYRLITLAERVRHDTYLATGYISTAGELADTVRKYLPGAHLTFDEQGPRFEDISSYTYDNRRAVEEFDWRVRSPEEAVLAQLGEAREEAGLAPLKRSSPRSG